MRKPTQYEHLCATVYVLNSSACEYIRAKVEKLCLHLYNIKAGFV